MVAEQFVPRPRFSHHRFRRAAPGEIDLHDLRRGHHIS
jgi:hypothetical protein